MRLHPGEVEASGWQVLKLSDVLQRLRAASPGVIGRPRVIAIDGRGGAGKSTVVERLRVVVPASAVVHTDDIAWNHAFFDWGGVLVENILRPLYRGEAVAFRPPAWIEHDRPGVIRIPADVDIVWVEGTGIIRHEFAQWIDASIWMQGDLDEQESRLVARDGDAPAQQQHIAQWLKEELPLMLREQPWEKATIIVSGAPELDYDPDTEIVVASPAVPDSAVLGRAPLPTTFHVMAGEVDHSRFELVFGDDFAGDALDTARWIDHYLPHWTTPERSAARYALNGHGLELLIEADQQAWRPEDGELRVSNLQTGSFSGPAGSSLGQHRHRRDLQVRSPQPSRRLWTPSEGLVEVAARASSDPTCMLAFWLIGFEEASPQESGEVCIAELYGNAIEPDRSQVRLGIKAHHDPNLRDEMTDVTLSLDARDEHSYATEWNSRRVRFFVDDQLVCTVEQGLDYPLQLMIDLFEFPATAERDPANYPKTAHLTAVRGYQPR